VLAQIKQHKQPKTQRAHTHTHTLYYSKINNNTSNPIPTTITTHNITHSNFSIAAAEVALLEPHSVAVAVAVAAQVAAPHTAVAEAAVVEVAYLAVVHRIAEAVASPSAVVVALHRHSPLHHHHYRHRHRVESKEEAAHGHAVHVVADKGRISPWVVMAPLCLQRGGHDGEAAVAVGGCRSVPVHLLQAEDLDLDLLQGGDEGDDVGVGVEVDNGQHLDLRPLVGADVAAVARRACWVPVPRRVARGGEGVQQQACLVVVVQRGLDPWVGRLNLEALPRCELDTRVQT
jgi:hypothetical protein